MIKQIVYLCFFFLSTKSALPASIDSLKGLYAKATNTHQNDWVYCDDIEEHRNEFLKWVASHGLWEPYSRVILTVNCRDADDIPKCPDAGKVFKAENYSYQLMHNGIKVIKDCYYDSWMTDLIYGLKGHHEPQEEKAFYEVLKNIPPKGTMIELGSYWAYYSLWFAKTVPEARNFLVEPDLDRLNIGRQNFNLNGLTGSFFHGYIGACLEDAGNPIGATQLFIDSFLESNGIDHVNILHSDIQGFEYVMLQTAINSIKAKKIDYFFISTHSEELHRNCIEFLENHDYEILAEHSPNESFSVDGLIVGKRRDLPGHEKIPISKRL